MYDRITWDVPIDTLKKVRWTFWLYNTQLVLDSYIVETRASTRHGFKAVEKYARLPTGEMRDPACKVIGEAEVPLTDEVREEAIRRFVSGITVARWSEVVR